MSGPTVEAGNEPRGGLVIKTTSRSSRGSTTVVNHSATNNNSTPSQLSPSASRLDTSSTFSRLTSAPDWMKQDIEWTSKYLSSDGLQSSRSRSPRPAATAAAAAGSSHLNGVSNRNSYDYEAPTVARTMRRTADDLFTSLNSSSSSSSRPRQPSPSHSYTNSSAQYHLNGVDSHHTISSSSSSALRNKPTATSNLRHLSASTSNINSRVTSPSLTVTRWTSVTSANEPANNTSSSSDYIGFSDNSATASSYTDYRPISETRRKIRKLICRSKGDPRYYDI